MEFVPHLVVDPGVDTTRIGKAGEDNPQFVAPSQVGVLQSSSDLIIGAEQLSKYTEGMSLKSFMGQDGFIHDHDLFNKYFERVYKELLPDSQGKPSITHIFVIKLWKNNFVVIAKTAKKIYSNPLTL